MTSESYRGFRRLVGSRADKIPALEDTCATLETMSYSDMQSLMTVMSDVRSREQSIRRVMQGNRFHEPSVVSPKAFHRVEGEIYDILPNHEFVELSPLQPFAINSTLAGVNEKNVVPALRRSEVNADATTALFRVAMDRFDGDETMTLAANVRTTRAQVFQEDTHFLPHFKVFAEVSVGKQSSQFGQKELETLSDHLASETAILDRVSDLPDSRLTHIRISVGNIILTQDLIARGLVSPEEIRKHTIDPSYDVFSAAGLDLPKSVAFDDPELATMLKDFGFEKGVRVSEHFQTVIEQRHPALLPRLTLDLGRIAGAGYYRHMAYKISGENTEGLVLPLADGGSTNWAEKTTHNKQLFTVSSGIGTELLCGYFL